MGICKGTKKKDATSTKVKHGSRSDYYKNKKCFSYLFLKNKTKL